MAVLLTEAGMKEKGLKRWFDCAHCGGPTYVTERVRGLIIGATFMPAGDCGCQGPSGRKNAGHDRPSQQTTFAEWDRHASA